MVFVRANQACLTTCQKSVLWQIFTHSWGQPGLGLGGAGTETEDTPYLPGARSETNYNTMRFIEAGRMDKVTAWEQFVTQGQEGSEEVPQA